ncbi:hypothetical protein [Caulifigura coniformis]|nr:hypothetical protein [Caulifigura coniformis]
MRRIARTLMICAGVATAGCQCCGCTEPIADLADKVSSRECEGEIFYSPGLDLTRIGRRDWCQCGINHWLCPCRCDQYCP